MLDENKGQMNPRKANNSKVIRVPDDKIAEVLAILAGKQPETPVTKARNTETPLKHEQGDKKGFLKLENGEKATKESVLHIIPSSIKPFPTQDEIKERAKTKNYFTQEQYPNPDERYILNRAILHSYKDYKPKPIPNYPTLKQFTR